MDILPPDTTTLIYPASCTMTHLRLKVETMSIAMSAVLRHARPPPPVNACNDADQHNSDGLKIYLVTIHHDTIHSQRLDQFHVKQLFYFE